MVCFVRVLSSISFSIDLDRILAYITDANFDLNKMKQRGTFFETMRTLWLGYLCLDSIRRSFTLTMVYSTKIYWPGCSRFSTEACTFALVQNVSLTLCRNGILSVSEVLAGLDLLIHGSMDAKHKRMHRYHHINVLKDLFSGILLGGFQWGWQPHSRRICAFLQRVLLAGFTKDQNIWFG